MQSGVWHRASQVKYCYMGEKKERGGIARIAKDEIIQWFGMSLGVLQPGVVVYSSYNVFIMKKKSKRSLKSNDTDTPEIGMKKTHGEMITVNKKKSSKRRVGGRDRQSRERESTDSLLIRIIPPLRITIREKPSVSVSIQILAKRKGGGGRN